MLITLKCGAVAIISTPTPNINIFDIFFSRKIRLGCAMANEDFLSRPCYGGFFFNIIKNKSGRLIKELDSFTIFHR